jgi:hypothetical protein
MNLALLRHRGYIQYGHGQDEALSEFNAYKHCFTNYPELMRLLTQSDIPIDHSIKIIGDIYTQIIDLVAPRYWPQMRQAWHLTTVAFKRNHQSIVPHNPLKSNTYLIPI